MAILHHSEYLESHHITGHGGASHEHIYSKNTGTWVCKWKCKLMSAAYWAGWDFGPQPFNHEVCKQECVFTKESTRRV